MLSRVAISVSKSSVQCRHLSVIKMRGVNGQKRAASKDPEAMFESLHGSKTHKKLREMFLHECASSIRYKIFAERAELEGLTGIADIFHSLAKSEQRQAEFLYRFVEDELARDILNNMPASTTLNNIKIALHDEKKDANENYKQAARVAFEEDFSHVNEMLHSMADTEKRHLEILNLTNDDLSTLLNEVDEEDKKRGVKLEDFGGGMGDEDDEDFDGEGDEGSEFDEDATDLEDDEEDLDGPQNYSDLRKALRGKLSK
jgi:rubrerythrin